MKKTVLIAALFILTTGGLQAQLLKKIKDKVAEKTKGGTKDETPASYDGSWTLLSNPVELLQGNKLTITDKEIETSDAVQKSLMADYVENNHMSAVWIFTKKGKVDWTRKGEDKTFQYSVSGNEVNVQTDQDNLKGKFFSKGNLVKYRFVPEGSNISVNLIFKADKKVGADAMDKETLSKAHFQYTLLNGDFYYSMEPPFYTYGYEKSFCNIKEDGTLEIMVFESSDYDPFKKFDVIRIPIATLKPESLKLLVSSNKLASSLNFETTTPFTIKKYIPGGKFTEETDTRYVLNNGYSRFSVGQEKLDAIAAKLPADAKAKYDKGTAARKAELAKYIAAADAQEKSNAASREAQRANLATIQMAYHGYGKYTINEKPAEGSNGKFMSYTFDNTKKSTDTKDITFMVGSTVIEASTGRVLFVVTKQMDMGRWDLR